jgi:RimJ/RimL family protein N-acetyltransferase
MKSIKILETDSSLISSLKELAEEATRAGDNFVQKTIEEWENGKNTFSKPGEKLWLISIENEIVAMGGLNRDPYIDNDKVGRVRHVYVSKKYRGQGLSKVLLKLIIDEAKKHFKILRLSTHNPIAASLYESFGFEKNDTYKATHIIKNLETYNNS